MERYCFFCTTPFQLITAIHLAMMREKKSVADLYIIDQFISANEVALKVSETGIFHDVILVKEETLINNRKKSKIFIWSQILFSYIVIKRKVKKILQRNFDVHYTHMYISSKAFVPRLVALYYAKKEEGTDIIYFDDGVGSYYNRDIFIPRTYDKIFRKILFGKKSLCADPRKILLYSPDLFYKADINASENIVVEKIPKWKVNPELKDITNKIFSYSANDSIEESIIIFDSLYTGERRKLLDEFYEQIIDVAGASNVIIKKHPRDKGTDNKNMKYYSRPDLPVEIIFQNTGVDEKLLIGVSTTALVTPVLLLDEEPFVLVLNKAREFLESSEVHFDDFKTLYKNPERFYEANSVSDAINFVKLYCSKYRTTQNNVG